MRGFCALTRVQNSPKMEVGARSYFKSSILLTLLFVLISVLYVMWTQAWYKHVFNTRYQYQPVSNGEGTTCQPVSNFVFIKCRKTGGSTTTDLLFRYGMKRGLTPVLASKIKSFITVASDNTPDIVQYRCPSFAGYNYIANHMQYNRAVMDELVPNAKFITILRSPYQQFHSAFYWYGYYDRLKSKSSASPFVTFFKPENKRKFMRKSTTRSLSGIKNGQIWMLGLDYEHHDNETAIDVKIKELDEELDLVMLLEYYDESLVLLQKLLCLDDEDMYYFVSKAHQDQQEPLPFSVRADIEEWNHADFKLYDHFNRTFWEKVRSYPGDFEEDLRSLRQRQIRVMAMCENENSKSKFCHDLKLDNKDLRTKAFHKQEALCQSPENS